MKRVTYHLNGVKVAEQVIIDEARPSAVSLAVPPGDVAMVTVTVSEFDLWGRDRSEDVSCIGVGV